MADKTEIRAVCTWGEAEDVTIVIKHSNKWADRFKGGLIFLMDKPLKKLFPDRPPSKGKLSGATHGYAHDAQWSMTAEEALSLSIELQQAAFQAKELSYSYREACLRDNARGGEQAE